MASRNQLVHTGEQWSSLVEACKGLSEVACKVYFSRSGSLVGMALAWGLGGGSQARYLPLQHQFGPNLDLSERELSDFLTETPLVVWDSLGFRSSVHSALGVCPWVRGCLRMRLSFLGFGVSESEAEGFPQSVQALLGLLSSDLESALEGSDSEWYEMCSEDSVFQEAVFRDIRLFYSCYGEACSRMSPEEGVRVEKEKTLAEILWESGIQGYRVSWGDLAIRSLEKGRAASSLEDGLRSIAGEGFNVNSQRDLRGVLFGDGGMGYTPVAYTPGQNLPRVNLGSLEKIRSEQGDPNDFIHSVLQHRELSRSLRSMEKLSEFRVGDRLQVSYSLDDKGQPVSRPNLASMPREVFSFFEADPGLKWVCARYPYESFCQIASFLRDDCLCDIWYSDVEDKWSALADLLGIVRGACKDVFTHCFYEGFNRRSLPLCVERGIIDEPSLHVLASNLPPSLKGLFCREPEGTLSPSSFTRRPYEVSELEMLRRGLPYLRSFTMGSYLVLPGAICFQVSERVSLGDLQKHIILPLTRHYPGNFTLRPVWSEGKILGSMLEDL